MDVVYGIIVSLWFCVYIYLFLLRDKLRFYLLINIFGGYYLVVFYYLLDFYFVESWLFYFFSSFIEI